jgi:hypothetical protein
VPLEWFKLAPQRQAFTTLRDDGISVIRAVIVDNDEFPGKVAAHSHRGKRSEGPPQRFRAIEGADGNRYDHRSGRAGR